MAGSSEIRPFQPSVPPGTAKNAPITVALTMPTRAVKHIRIRVPPGPNGLMGFALTSGGLNVIPYGQGQFIVASDEVIDWDPIDEIDSGAWQATMYNTGIFTHTIYILFTVEVPDQPDTASGVQPLIVPGPTTPDATIPTIGDSSLPPPPEVSE